MTALDLEGNHIAEMEVRKTAVLSDRGTYRYRLTRQWDLGKAMLPVCMLNPSTADAEKDDPTIKALMRFAGNWGYGGITVINLFAVRTSQPHEAARMAAWGG
jgi:hypothetical protein